MDEMNNMNEVTTEEISNEVTPVVAESNEVHEEAKNLNLGRTCGLALAGGILVGSVGYTLYEKHKAKKAAKKAEKEQKPKKVKKHIKPRLPWEFVEDEPVKDVEYKDVVEDTTEEEN